MMANKWVQEALVFGIAIGFWISAWVNMAQPFLSFWISYPIFFFSIFLLLRARESEYK